MTTIIIAAVFFMPLSNLLYIIKKCCNANIAVTIFKNKELKKILTPKPHPPSPSHLIRPLGTFS